MEIEEVVGPEYTSQESVSFQGGGVSPLPQIRTSSLSDHNVSCG